MKKSGHFPAKAGKAKSKGQSSSPQGQSGSKAPATPLQTKDGAPMIYSQGTVRSQKSKQAWKEELHIYLRKKHPDVADQIITLERDAPEEPTPPEEPAVLAETASEADKAIYAVRLQVYATQLNSYEKRMDRHKEKMRDFVAKEKAAHSCIWETVGEEMRNRILSSDEDIATSNDLINLIKLIDEHYLFTGTESEDSKIKKALKSYYNCSQGQKEPLLSY